MAARVPTDQAFNVIYKTIDAFITSSMPGQLRHAPGFLCVNHFIIFEQSLILSTSTGSESLMFRCSLVHGKPPIAVATGRSHYRAVLVERHHLFYITAVRCTCTSSKNVAAGQ